MSGTCRYCNGRINFIRTDTGDWDWCADPGTIRCDAGYGRHYPVDPIEGIDY